MDVGDERNWATLMAKVAVGREIQALSFLSWSIVISHCQWHSRVSHPLFVFIVDHVPPEERSEWWYLVRVAV